MTIQNRLEICSEAPTFDSPMRPRENGGVLIPNLPSYNTELDDSYRKHVDTIVHEGLGTTWIEEWRMDDGTTFDVSINEPLSHAGDVVVVKDTAWGTQVRGFNEDTARIFMSLGLKLVIKGPEKNAAIPLSHSAHNTHKVLDRIETIGFHEKGYALVDGYSRGAMIGFGTVAYAQDNDREIIFANLVDPCIPRPLTELGSDDLIEVAKHAPAELLTAGWQLGKLALNPLKAWHYRRTPNISVAGAKEFINTGKAVFSGEAGSMAANMPDDARAVVVFYLNSCANEVKIYQDLLAGKPDVDIKLTGRGHLSGMDKRGLGSMALGFSGIARQLKDGVHPTELVLSKTGRPKLAAV